MVGHHKGDIMAMSRVQVSARFYPVMVCLLQRHYLVAGMFVVMLAVASAPAASVSPLYSSSAGAATHIAIANLPLNSNWVVTAAKNSAGNLEVVAWNDNGSAIVQTGSATGGAINGVAITGIAANRAVTADISTTTGYMELSVWKVDLSTGTIAQQGSTISICCTATSVAITATDTSHIETGANLAGHFYVNAFGVSSTGVFTSEGSAEDSATVGQATIVPLGSKQVATVFRNGSGQLEITTWSLSGILVTLEKHATGGLVKQVSATTIYANQITTAVVNSVGNLELLNWGVTSTGKATKQTSATAGAASKVAICNLPIDPFTANIDSSGELSVATWTSGTILTEAASYNSTDSASSIAVAPDWGSDVGAAAFITAARNRKGNLEVAVWQVYY